MKARYPGQTLATYGALLGPNPAGRNVAIDAFFTPGVQTIAPTGIASAQAFGTTAVMYAPQAVSPAATASAEAFGTPAVTLTIAPAGIASAEVVNVPATSGGTPAPQTIVATAIASGETHGAAKLNLNVGPSAIASGEAFGTARAATVQTVEPSAIASGEASGSPAVTTTTPPIEPPSIESGEAVGVPLLLSPFFRAIRPTPIDDAEAVGTPSLSTSPNAVLVVAIASAGVVSQPTFYVAAGPGEPVNPTPRNVLRNLGTGHTYEWAINHTSEETVRVGRALDRGAPNADVGLVRQQRDAGSLVLGLSGTILDPAQRDEFEGFFDDCEDDTLIFRDAAGDEYRVIVSSWDCKRVSTPRNPRHPDLRIYWTYSFTLEVLEVLAGPYAAV